MHVISVIFALIIKEKQSQGELPKAQYLQEFKVLASSRENDIMHRNHRKKALGRIYPG